MCLDKHKRTHPSIPTRHPHISTPTQTQNISTSSQYSFANLAGEIPKSTGGEPAIAGVRRRHWNSKTTSERLKAVEALPTSRQGLVSFRYTCFLSFRFWVVSCSDMLVLVRLFNKEDDVYRACPRSRYAGADDRIHRRNRFILFRYIIPYQFIFLVTSVFHPPNLLYSSTIG
ncbi:hypothetical protein HanPI659440_Chr09g0325951 [Helianthus annuus]|nr:hypothetical protein HanPI659440_Chr09g0325951 [Helianthus annuus]